MNLIKSYFVPTILAILGLFLVSIAGYKHYVNYKNEQYRQKRIVAIKAGMDEMYKDCSSVNTFDSRRECFKDRMTKMRKNNSQVKTKYKIIFNGQIIETNSEDLGDLLSINKDLKVNFSRCSSNTFFLDWNDTKMYISLENPLGSIFCSTPRGDEIYFIPSDLTEAQIDAVKQEFKVPIK